MRSEMKNDLPLGRNVEDKSHGHVLPVVWVQFQVEFRACPGFFETDCVTHSFGHWGWSVGEVPVLSLPFCGGSAPHLGRAAVPREEREGWKSYGLPGDVEEGCQGYEAHYGGCGGVLQGQVRPY